MHGILCLPFCSLCCCAGNLAVTLSFDGLLAQLGLGGTYLLYGLANVGAALYVGQLLVETRCRWDELFLPNEPSLAPQMGDVPEV
jgi:hypothetical protein